MYVAPLMQSTQSLYHIRVFVAWLLCGAGACLPLRMRWDVLGLNAVVLKLHADDTDC